MKILITVVIGYVNSSNNLKTNHITDEFTIKNVLNVRQEVAAKINEMSMRWPEGCPGLQNVLSATYIILP